MDGTVALGERPWCRRSCLSAKVSMRMRMRWRSMFANLADEFILNLHLLSKLPPYLSQSQLVVCVDETIEFDNMELVLVVFRHVCYNGLDQLCKSCQLLPPRAEGGGGPYCRLAASTSPNDQHRITLPSHNRLLNKL